MFGLFFSTNIYVGARAQAEEDLKKAQAVIKAQQGEQMTKTEQGLAKEYLDAVRIAEEARAAGRPIDPATQSLIDRVGIQREGLREKHIVGEAYLENVDRAARGEAPIEYTPTGIVEAVKRDTPTTSGGRTYTDYLIKQTSEGKQRVTAVQQFQGETREDVFNRYNLQTQAEAIKRTPTTRTEIAKELLTEQGAKITKVTPSGNITFINKSGRTREISTGGAMGVESQAFLPTLLRQQHTARINKLRAEQLAKDRDYFIVPKTIEYSTEAILKTHWPEKVVQPPEKEGFFAKLDRRVAEKTTYKFIPSYESTVQQRNITYSRLQKMKETKTGFFSPEASGKIKFSDIFKSFSTKTERGKYDARMIQAVRENKTFEEYLAPKFAEGVVFEGLKLIRDKPVSVTATIAGGHFFGAGTTALASIGAKSATAVSLGGLTLAGTYGFEKYTQLKAAKTLYEKGRVFGGTVVEAGAFGVGAHAGGSAAVKAGFIPQPSYIPKIKFRKFEIRTTEKIMKPKAELVGVDVRGEYNLNKFFLSKKTPKPSTTPTLYQGIEVFQPSTGKGFPLVGAGQGRVYLGSKGFSKIQFPETGVSLSASSPTHLRIARAALKKSGRAGEAQKLELIYNVASKTFKTKSKLYTKTVEKPKTFKTEEGTQFILKELSDVKNIFGLKRATLQYGSAFSKLMLRPKYRKLVGESGDIDTFLFKGNVFGEKFALKSAKGLRGFGEKSYVEKSQPLLIQQRAGKETHHMVDIHTLEGGGGRDKPQESFFGLPFGQKPVRAGKLDIMPLSEAGLRSASSITTLRFEKGEAFIAPEAHRTKDISRFFPFEKELTSLEGRGKSELKALEEFYPKEIIYGKTPEAKSIYSLPKRSPSPSFGIPSSMYIPSPSPYTSPSTSPSPIFSPSLSPSPSVSPSPSMSPSLSPSPSPSPSPTTFILPKISLPKRRILTPRKIELPKIKQPKQYTPTLHAVVGGIKRKSKKKSKGLFTGLEQRGIN